MRETASPTPDAAGADTSSKAGGRAAGGSSRVAKVYGARSTVQRKASGPAGQVESLLAGTNPFDSLPSGGGQSLPGDVVQRVESATGASVGDARVHTGAQSAKAAASVGARAFTIGSDIHMGAGESTRDTRLMAHETAHTIQQSGGAVAAQAKLAVSSPGDALEREADAVAEAAVSGGRASVSGGVGSGEIQRDVVSDVRDKLSYGAFDWAITDSEATEALELLAGLGTDALSDAMSSLEQMYKTRLLDNLPSSAKSTSGYTKVLCAMGPAAIQPYVESLLSYGVFDWAITDNDAATVFRIMVNVEPASQTSLWTRLGSDFRGRLIENLNRSATIGPSEHAVLETLFTGTPDSEIEHLKGLMKLRFRIHFGPSQHPGKAPLEFDAAGLRQIWPVLAALPPSHVENNSALDFFERYTGGGSAGGFYSTARNNVGMKYGANRLNSRNGAAQENVTRADGSVVDDPLWGVNRFDKVVRHEIGHAVDRGNGHSDSYCVGNAAGGDWTNESKSTMAQTMVTASAGDINGWSNAEQKTAIIAALQEVIDGGVPGQIDAKIDAIDGLSAEDRAKVKADDAVRALRVCFSSDSPWYSLPDAGGIPLNGRIYQQAYQRDSAWWSYQQDTRDRKVSLYQYRAPGEWFAEAYATYYLPGEKGAALSTVDPDTKAWFDANVDPDGGAGGGDAGDGGGSDASTSETA